MMTLWPYHSEDEISAVADVLRSGKTNYWSGPNGQAFESEFAQYTGAKHALAVTNGTTALELALHGLDLPHGSEVIVPCRTFMATASAVVTAGCKPVLADIDATLNVTVETLEARTDFKDGCGDRCPLRRVAVRHGGDYGLGR
jgi:dTDP-4-amino-4,6-dideoxygalactose transaminase